MIAESKKTTASPYGFRITIERRRRTGVGLELNTFPAKTPMLAVAQKAAHYKDRFLRIVSIETIQTREEWDRVFGKKGRPS